MPLQFCPCGRALPHEFKPECEKPRVRASMEARCVSGSTTGNGHNPDIREDTVRQARDTLCDASALLTYDSGV